MTHEEHEDMLKDRISALEAENAKLRDALTRRSGASSWEEFKGIWDPTEETSVDAIRRLREDAERLDWLEKEASDGKALHLNDRTLVPLGAKILANKPTLRSAIDEARKTC